MTDKGAPSLASFTIELAKDLASFHFILTTTSETGYTNCYHHFADDEAGLESFTDADKPHSW